jgi:hypothetical protein
VNQNKTLRRKNEMAQKSENQAKLTKVVTGKVRLSYVTVFQPKETEFGPKYSAVALIPKSDKVTLQKIQNAINEAKKAGPAAWKQEIKNPHLPIRDGDGEKTNGGEYGEECKGCFVLNMASSQKPGVVDGQLNAIIDSTELYSGCYARVSVNFYPNPKGLKGIACGLNNIQKLADGDYLGGRSRAEDDFEPMGDSADEAEDLFGI